MASTSPGYGITIRVEGPPSAQPVAEVTTAITAAGAAITALDVVESFLDHVVSIAERSEYYDRRTLKEIRRRRS